MNILEHLKERLDELATLRKIAEIPIDPILNQITTRGNCPSPDTSLTKRLAIDEPLNVLISKRFINIDIYYDVYERFREDIEKYHRLIKGNFEANLKDSLGIHPEATMILHKEHSILCVYPEVKVKPEVTTIEVKKQEVTEIPKNILDITVKLITSKPTVVTKIVAVTKAVEEVTTKTPNITKVVTKPPTLPTIKPTIPLFFDTKYIKMTQFEVIIAGTSITITLIAVCNCLWVAIVLIKRRRNIDQIEVSPSEIELTPMLERKPKVKFGTSKITEFSPYNSTATLPSPAPVRNRKDK